MPIRSYGDAHMCRLSATARSVEFIRREVNQRAGVSVIPAFKHEEACLELVRRLQKRWDGVVRRYPNDYTNIEREAVQRIADHDRSKQSAIPQEVR